MSDHLERYAHAPRVIARRIRGELVLVRVPELEALVLSPSGAVVWDAARDVTLDELAEAVAAAAGQAVDHVRADVESFVTHLLEEGLLVSRSADPQ